MRGAWKREKVAQAAFFMAAAGFINAQSNALFKTEQPALIATAFHAHLASRIVVQVGCLTRRAAQAAAINPKWWRAGTRMGLFLDEVRTIMCCTTELAEPDFFPKPQTSVGAMARAVPLSGSAV